MRSRALVLFGSVTGAVWFGASACGSDGTAGTHGGADASTGSSGGAAGSTGDASEPNSGGSAGQGAGGTPSGGGRGNGGSRASGGATDGGATGGGASGRGASGGAGSPSSEAGVPVTVCKSAQSTGAVQKPKFVRNIAAGETGWFSSPAVVDLDGNG